MRDDDILFLNGNEIIEIFRGRERDIMNAVKAAYQTHAKGDSALPHSSFLRFPDSERNRIIALPAYLGGEFRTAGIKWISSFPGNLEKDIERASAVLILNSLETGRPKAIMESSVVSSSRTAASAAIAADCLQGSQPLHSVGLIGCGLINHETFRFLFVSRPEIKNVFIYDVSTERAEQFRHKCQQLSGKLNIAVVKSPDAVLQKASVTAFATTAIKPHIFDISGCRSDSIILHISLRDLSPEIILSADNIADDIDHICRAQTSVHLAEQQVGHRNFIRCTIGDIFNGDASPRQNNKISIFSPFGLGILDLAVGDLACKLTEEKNCGTVIQSFFPIPWTQR